MNARRRPSTRETLFYSGKLSCFLAGISTRFSRSMASARATRARVALGMITSSM
jgi:hypothetical protein